MANDVSQLPTFALLAYVALGILIALPSLAALRWRRQCRVHSEFAGTLAEYAAAVRREHRCIALDDVLLVRARSLRIPELITFEYLRELTPLDPALLADAAQRLALRLKRRVAFARKMLARTASGRRRAALVAAAPACLMLILSAWGLALPHEVLAVLLALEGIGCWLLWYFVRAGI